MNRGSFKRKAKSPASSELWDAEQWAPAAPRRRREQEHLTGLSHALRKLGGFFYKIPDMPHIDGATRFDTEKPFDAFVVHKRRRMAIEAKAFDKPQAFGARHIRPSQERGLDAFAAAGGEAWVFLFVKDRLYPLEWRALRERFKVRGSIKKAEMQAMPFVRWKPTGSNTVEIERWLTQTKP